METSESYPYLLQVFVATFSLCFVDKFNSISNATLLKAPTQVKYNISLKFPAVNIFYLPFFTDCLDSVVRWRFFSCHDDGNKCIFYVSSSRYDPKISMAFFTPMHLLLSASNISAWLPPIDDHRAFASKFVNSSAWFCNTMEIYNCKVALHVYQWSFIS